MPVETPPDGAAQHPGEGTPAIGTVADAEVRIRRAPRYPIFLILGGGLGAVVTFVLTALFPVDPAVGFGALFGYFAIYGVSAGVLVGALVAIVLDRASSRRAKSVVVEHTTVDPVPSADDTAVAEPAVDDPAADPAAPDAAS
ncbi:hypothetical protein [Lacisediminihabitans sp.]|uniref:hypothetical protein n=1 Tax=Lacisediminihabitans sp. TaxID=2787631 RepID=UPI00374CCF10